MIYPAFTVAYAKKPNWWLYPYWRTLSRSDVTYYDVIISAFVFLQNKVEPVYTVSHLRILMLRNHYVGGPYCCSKFHTTDRSPYGSPIPNVQLWRHLWWLITWCHIPSHDPPTHVGYLWVDGYKTPSRCLVRKVHPYIIGSYIIIHTLQVIT